jgi:peptide deformylase
MSLRKIVRWPDPRLATLCEPVAKITPAITTLAADMLETMYDAPGRGLAAPQVGVLSRVFVMDTTWKDGARDPLIFVNPEILTASAERATLPEGCLSIPGVSVEVTRALRVRLRWTDLDGRQCKRVFDGFPAACVQHEIDHLDGIVTLDWVDADTRARILADYDPQPA